MAKKYNPLSGQLEDDKPVSWSGVTINNEPIDVEGYIRKSETKANIVRTNSKKSTPKLFQGDNQASSTQLNLAKASEGGEQEQQVDTQRGAKDGGKAAAKTGLEKLAENSDNEIAYKKAMAGANFLIDVINANSAYSAAKGQAQLNILQARNDAADAIYRGRVAQFDRQSEGLVAGNDARLAMAAQGQEVDGGGTNKLSGSYEAMGYQAGAREMINAYKEALGYEFEEVVANWQVDQAGIARDNQYFGSALELGVTLAVL